MNITFSEIAYLLSQKHQIKENRDAYFDAPLASVKRYRGQVERRQLYSIPVERLGELTAHPLIKLAECAFVAWGRGTKEQEEYWKTLMEGKKKVLDVLYVCDVEFEEDLQEELVELFCSLHMWEAQLQESCGQEQIQMQDLLSEGRKVIGLPLAVFDRNFVILGCTEDYFLYFPEMRDRMIDHQMSQQDIKELLQNDDYLNAEEEKTVFIYPPRPAENNLLCYNMRFSGEYSARILMRLPEYHVHSGIHQLFSSFVKYVENLYLNNLRRYPAENQDDVLHHLFKKYLFHPRRKDFEVDFQALSMYNWHRNDEYQIMVLQIFGAREFEQGSPYLCQQLERRFEYSCTFRTDREIIWIINYTRERKMRTKEDFYSNVTYLIRDFGCKAGMSNRFNDFTLLSNYRRQADIALEIGNKKDSYRWVYTFREYTLDYMMNQTTTLFSPEQLAHEGLQKLQAYDEEHETEFVKTLYYYIIHQFNASEAAQKLYIHRTTFIRRMERIESLISVKMNDPDELLHILLSYKLLERKEKKDE